MNEQYANKLCQLFRFGKLTSDIQDAFYVQMGGINWLVYNIQRSLGEAATSETEKQLGIAQTEQTLRILEYLADNINFWFELI